MEIDLNAPLLPSHSVDGNSLRIEYEGLQIICFNCGKFGHNSDQCPHSSQREGGNGRTSQQGTSSGEDTVPKKGEEDKRKFTVSG